MTPRRRRSVGASTLDDSPRAAGRSRRVSGRPIGQNALARNPPARSKASALPSFGGTRASLRPSRPGFTSHAIGLELRGDDPAPGRESRSKYFETGRKASFHRRFPGHVAIDGWRPGQAAATQHVAGTAHRIRSPLRARAGASRPPGHYERRARERARRFSAGIARSYCTTLPCSLRAWWEREQSGRS